MEAHSARDTCLVEAFKVICSLAQLHLHRLRICYLSLQVPLVNCNSAVHACDGKVQLLDFRAILCSVSLNSLAVFFLLLLCHCPLFQFLLTPIHQDLHSYAFDGNVQCQHTFIHHSWNMLYTHALEDKTNFELVHLFISTIYLILQV